MYWAYMIRNSTRPSPCAPVTRVQSIDFMTRPGLGLWLDFVILDSSTIVEPWPWFAEICYRRLWYGLLVNKKEYICSNGYNLVSHRVIQWNAFNLKRVQAWSNVVHTFHSLLDRFIYPLINGIIHVVPFQDLTPFGTLPLLSFNFTVKWSVRSNWCML